MEYTQHNISFNDVDLVFFDAPNNSTKWLLNEIFIQDVYKFNSMVFAPGDIVVDVGANIGLFSIYLAKKYPFLKIYSFEPFPINFSSFLKNLDENKVTNVIPVPLAITADRRRISLLATEDNLGGATSYVYDPDASNKTEVVSSITLDDVFNMFDLKQIKMLKIDCEGGEYEILPTIKRLSSIEYLVGEFHYLYGHRDPKPLVDFCEKYFTSDKLQILCY